MKRQQIHAELFRRTTTLHQQLDRHPALAPLLAPGLQTQTYGAVLQRLQACLHGCEAALAGWERSNTKSGRPDYVARGHFLVRDIERLGLPLRPGLPAPQPDTEAAYLGQRYVLEGAALGSAHIRQHLLRHARGLPADAMQYFSVQEVQTAHWPQFLQLLEPLKDDTNSLAAAGAAAIAVFTHFLSVLDETIHAV
jgi:heme oxygenase (biliverdin-IX-beta and delta-forming)